MKPFHVSVKKVVCIYLLLVPGIPAAFAQTAIGLSGTVINVNGAAVSGAQVMLHKYPSLAAQTDQNGNFSLTGPVGISSDAISGAVPRVRLSGSLLGLGLDRAADVDVRVHCMDGGRVYAAERRYPAGEHRLSLPLADAGTGVYMVSVGCNGASAVVFRHVFAGEEHAVTVRQDAAAGKTAAVHQVLDTLTVSAPGYENRTLALSGYAVSGISVMLTPGAVTYTGTSTPAADGVVFTFNAPRTYGHFLPDVFGTRYPYVVGATQVTYTPGPAGSGGYDINGSVINPVCQNLQGFHGRHGTGRYDPALNAGLGTITLQPGQSLVVGVADPAITVKDNSIKQFVVLTCVAAVPPGDAFRPCFADGDKTIHRESQIVMDPDGHPAVLGRLAHWVSMPDWSLMETRAAKLIPDMGPNWDRGHFESPGHPPMYGRDLCKFQGQPQLMANCDYTWLQKRKTVIGLVQSGIDRYGLVQSRVNDGQGMPWHADGGHNSGRKFSIMFAGHLLNVDAMRTITGFQEDQMYFFTDQATVDATNGPAWDPPYSTTYAQQAYSAGMYNGGTYPMPDWQGRAEGPEKRSASWTGHPYRLSPNNGSQHGQALAALVMGLQDEWEAGNPAYFDYHARFIKIMNGNDDPWRFRGGTVSAYDPVTGSVKTSGSWDNWEKNWNDMWIWAMILRNYWTYYRFPWE